MHYRVSAWVVASGAAPALMILTTVAPIVWRRDVSTLLTALFWQGLLGFLAFTLSLVLFCPLLLVPTERTPLYRWPKIALAVFAGVTGSGRCRLLPQ